MSETPTDHNDALTKEQSKKADEILNSGHNVDAKWGGIIGWFAHNHVAANILMLLFVIGGLLSVSQMRTETFPTVDPKLVTVSVVYPGATPYEIAESVTSRVEDALVGMNGVKRIYSKAHEGAGTVYVEMTDFADGDKVYNDVETAVNGLADFPPEDAERPIVNKTELTPPVLRFALYGDVNEEALKYWTETIKDELRALPDVSLISISGLKDYQISIELSESALRDYGITLAEVSRAIQDFSVDVPAGMIEASQGDILLRVQEKRYTADEFGSIVVRTLPNGGVLRLDDIATIVDSFEDYNLISEYNGQRASFITVNRNDNQDTMVIAGRVVEYLENVQLPTGLNIGIQEDQTFVLQERMSLMMRNAVLGFMLVFIVLLLFLDLKLAFWTSVAIPVSFLGGLMIIHFMGYSINMVSLFALIVVLGIVVDDAIVTGESIFDAQERYSDNPHAVMHGVKRVLGPVTIGVTTTIAAFAPLIFSTGTLGQIIKVIPIAVIPILVVSLLEAFLILPSHLESYKRWSHGIVADIRERCTQGLAHVIKHVITPAAKQAISWRYVTLAGFMAWMIITAGMVSSGQVRFIFFPSIEGDNVDIALTMPQGTPFETTKDTMRVISDAVFETRESLKQETGYDIFESVAYSVGQDMSDADPFHSSDGAKGNNLGKILIRLVPSDLRTYSSTEIEAMIRKRVGDLPGVEKLSYESSMMGEDSDIELDLMHPNDAMLNAAAEELQKQLKAIDGTKEVTDTFEEGKLEYVFEVTPEGLAVGVTPAMLGSQLRAAYFGEEAQRIQRDGEEVLVYVRYPKALREDLATLKQTRIRLDDGREVPLLSVAKVHQHTGYSSIDTVDGRRIVTVFADVDYAVNTPGAVVAELNETIMPALMETYPGLSFSFEGETREQAEDMASLGRNMTLALLLIFVLLGSQLRSYVQPIVIMSAIPFGIVGAIWGHYLLGHDLSFISMFGIVALSGVVVNDSVVLVDYFNLQRQAGRSTYDSLILAIQRRFRPILLTTLTTSLGLMPMLFETSMQARFLIPMVISLAMGIIFATVVILVFIPVLIMIIDDIKKGTAKLHNMVNDYAVRKIG